MRLRLPLLCFVSIFSLSACAMRNGVSPEFRSSGGNAAQVGPLAITAEELDRAVKDDLKGIEAQVYEIKQARLARLIQDKLWALEAREKNVPLSQLQEEAEGGAKDEFERMSRRQSFLASLREKYPVRAFLKPPRFSIQLEHSPIRGNAQAPVTIVEFSDFECPYCGSVQPAIQEIRRQYPDQVRFVFKHFPLPFHSKAKAAHLAALCAEESGKFWEYRDQLFKNQKALERNDLIRYAEDLGIPSESFKTCLEGEKYQAKIDQDISEGLRSGVNGTPSFFVNGRPFAGGQSAASFQQIIEEELGGNRP